MKENCDCLMLTLADAQWLLLDQVLKIFPTTNGRAPSDVFVTSENLLGVMDRVTCLHTRINKS